MKLDRGKFIISETGHQAMRLLVPENGDASKFLVPAHSNHRCTGWDTFDTHFPITSSRVEWDLLGTFRFIWRKELLDMCWTIMLCFLLYYTNSITAASHQLNSFRKVSMQGVLDGTAQKILRQTTSASQHGNSINDDVDDNRDWAETEKIACVSGFLSYSLVVLCPWVSFCLVGLYVWYWVFFNGF